MDPSKVFCHNPDCPARGKTGYGNIGIHSRKEKRYICHTCGKTFTESKGTVFYPRVREDLRHPVEFVTQMITLLAYGCPIPAIVAAFGLDELTVVSWQSRAGEHCEKVHKHLVQHPRDLGQVQALYLPGNRIHWVPRTPAIAAGITDHIWTVHELLSYQVPLPPWEPPKQRGRPSKRIKELIKQWCYDDHT